MTNGEKILNAFPNATTRVCKNKDFTYIEMEQNDKWIADFDMEWWNTEYKEPTTKNNLGVDCIDRQATLDAIIKRLGIKNETYLLEAERTIYQQILAMPSVTLQEPILNKIRVDIENDWQLKEYPSSPFSCGLRRAIEIIDKYKTESEPQESEVENGNDDN